MEWPTREPGRPYRWLLELATERVAPTCPQHHRRTNALGVCALCVSDWRRALGADPLEWIECRVCGLPLHPAAEAGGFDTCPTCSEVQAS